MDPATVIALCKENIQPLRHGRNATQLGTALRAQEDVEAQQLLQQERQMYEDSIKNYVGDDPLENWYDYILWVEQSYPKSGHESPLAKLLQQCLRIFEKEVKYHQDRRFIRLWINYISMQKNPLELYQFLYNNGIGTMVADLYRAWAFELEQAQDIKKADEVYSIGLHCRAEPREELEQSHKNFQLAVARRMLGHNDDRKEISLAEQRQAFSSLKAIKAGKKVGSIRIGHRVRDYMPGAVPQQLGNQGQRTNAPIQVYQDEAPVEMKGTSILDHVPIEEAIHKENTIKPGPWNNNARKCPVISSAVKPSFKVHEDTEVINMDKIRLFPNHVPFHDDSKYDGYEVPVFVPDVPNPKIISKPHYPKDLVYENNVDKSLEQIRAQMYIERYRQERNLPLNIKIQESNSLVQGSMQQGNNINHHIPNNNHLIEERQRLEQQHREVELERQRLLEQQQREAEIERQRQLEQQQREAELEKQRQQQRQLELERQRCEAEMKRQMMYEAEQNEFKRLEAERLQQQQQQQQQQNSGYYGHFHSSTDEQNLLHQSMTVNTKEAISVVQDLWQSPSGNTSRLMPSPIVPKMGEGRSKISFDIHMDSSMTQNVMATSNKLQHQQSYGPIQPYNDQENHNFHNTYSNHEHQNSYGNHSAMQNSYHYPVQPHHDPNQQPTQQLHHPHHHAQQPIQTQHQHHLQSPPQHHQHPQAMMQSHHHHPLQQVPPHMPAPHQMPHHQTSPHAIPHHSSPQQHHHTVTTSQQYAQQHYPQQQMPFQHMQHSPINQQQQQQHINTSQLMNTSQNMNTSQHANTSQHMNTSQNQSQHVNTSQHMNTSQHINTSQHLNTSHHMQQHHPHHHNFHQHMQHPQQITQQPQQHHMYNNVVPNNMGYPQPYASPMQSAHGSMEQPQKQMQYPGYVDPNIEASNKSSPYRMPNELPHIKSPAASQRNLKYLENAENKENSGIGLGFNADDSVIKQQQPYHHLQQHHQNENNPYIDESLGISPLPGVNETCYTETFNRPLIASTPMTNHFKAFKAPKDLHQQQHQLHYQQQQHQHQQQHQVQQSPEQQHHLQNHFQQQMQQQQLQHYGNQTVVPPPIQTMPASDQLGEKLSTIMESTREYVSSSSASSGTTKIGFTITRDDLPTIKEQSTFDDTTTNSHYFGNNTHEQHQQQQAYEQKMRAQIQALHAQSPRTVQRNVDQITTDIKTNCDLRKSISFNGNGATASIDTKSPEHGAIAEVESKPALPDLTMDYECQEPMEQQTIEEEAKVKEKEEEKKVVEEEEEEEPPFELPEGDIDPFNRTLISGLLRRMKFPQPHHADGYVKLSSNLVKFVPSTTITLGNNTYDLDKCLGKGTYGTVFKGTDLQTRRVVALKTQKPAWVWEYYISREIKTRLTNPHMLRGFMDVTTSYIADNGSVLVTEFSKYGTLLEVTNKIKISTGKPLSEPLAIFFTIEMIQIVEYLHKCQIIHADIKPDNFLLMHMPSEDVRPTIQLIDYGCSIDMSLFPDGTKFTQIIKTEDFTCIEMQTGKPWTYQTDLYCLAASSHCLLFGNYMRVSMNGDKWYINSKLPRYAKKAVWERYFTELLNIESCEKLPDLTKLRNLMEEALAQMPELQTKYRQFSNVLNHR